MVLNAEQLEQKAHELALIHQPVNSKRPNDNPLRAWHRDMESLRQFAAALKEEEGACTQPAEQWLLDHADFIEKEALVVERELKHGILRKLTWLRNEPKPRVTALGNAYYEATNGRLEYETLISFVNAYQEIAILTLAEAWSMPIMLRMAAIERLAALMREVRERHEACVRVERLLKSVAPADGKLCASDMQEALERHGERLPLSGAVLVHLVSHLNEWADDAGAVREWLVCKLDADADNLSRIVTYEHQLQASHEVECGHLIGSLRALSRGQWQATFERISVVERTLAGEAAGTYSRMDETSRHTLRQRVEQLAERFGVPENLIASKAVELAADADAPEPEPEPLIGRNGPEALPSRDNYAAYYLLDSAGIERLHQSLRSCSEPRANRGSMVRRRRGTAYMSMIGFAFAAFAVIFALWAGGGVHLTVGMWVAAIALIIMPASEWAVTAGQSMVGNLVRSRPLLRYDYAPGMPDDAKTMVVMPIIWSKIEEVEELTDRLELHYLANRDSQLYFALLGDYPDAQSERLSTDEKLLKAARERIGRLNEQYPREDGGRTFHLFQRRRQWNESEKAWIGWERKRGKLVELVSLLRGDAGTSYLDSSSLPQELSDVRYLITLDADTQLPLGAAQRMVGTMHLPYNRPRLNERRTRVVEGYGVLQPRIGVSYESVSQSRLARLWSGEPGIDPYAFAMSDPYQDTFGQGIFTGKGIIDIDSFAAVLSDRIPENTVLSHDLLEGGFLRGGLLSDIELIDGHPAKFGAYQQRLHRWVRGDWQLLCWLKPKVCNRTGKLQKVDLSALTRWQIVDNMRRSLLQPALLLTLLAAPFLPPWTWAVLTTIALMTVFLPFIRSLLQPVRLARKPSAVAAALGQSVVTLVALPYQTAVMLDAVARTLYRMLGTKRKMLEWTSSAEVERRSKQKQTPAVHGLGAGIVLALAFGAISLISAHAPTRWIGGIIAAAWLLAPVVARWLSQPPAVRPETMTEEERERLTGLARDIWSYFDRYTVEAEHWLAPDNVQLDPPVGPARRTSPTNIGLQLACTLAARDFGFIDTLEMLMRMERTTDTIERLEKWNGHLYNWYETTTLRPLPPLYVSTVDSGNFVGYLVTVKEGIAEHAFGTDGGKGAAVQPSKTGRIREQAKRLIARLEKLIDETDFRPLYDDASQLFALGYHVSTDRKETILYDLLASEARQTSLLAIAFGQAPAAHWFKLGRAMTRSGKDATLLSWSGTMFEYLMPALLMKTFRNSIWDRTYRGVVRRQIQYAAMRNVPFGISESGYYAFDYQMNYQYRAFGVPGLGFQRGLEEDLVLAPYATIMALPYAKREALDALRRMEQMGARGEHGYYEAIDCTGKRLPEGKRCAVIRSFMVHHQGMSLLTLANELLPRTMIDRFHADKRIQAVELLLQERMPDKPAIVTDSVKSYTARAEAVQEQERTAPLREFTDPITALPEVCVLSNGAFSSVVTASGGGFTRHDGVAVSRWREDPVVDPPGIGMYIRDVTGDAVWSPAYEPCRVRAEEMRTQFALHQASFMRKDGPIGTELNICVSPELNAEVRRLTLTNESRETRIFEVTTYTEVVLAPPSADDAHPAFSKLFVQTEYDEQDECLLAVRRPRDDHEKPRWAVQSLSTGCESLGPIEYETDRACFIGRGHSLQHPQSLASKLSGTVGAVLDPIFAIRRRISIGPGEQVKLYAITGSAESREEAVAISRALCGQAQIDRTFQLAWTHSRIDLRHQRITAQEASLIHTLAGRVLYASPLRPERADSIAANAKGQSGLWSMGISGDLPIVLVTMADRSQLPFAIRLMSGHGYLCRKGIPFDLVIVNESAGGYQQDVTDSLRIAIEQNVDKHAVRPGGVYPVAANQMSDEERTLLFAVARYALRADGPSLKAQLKAPRRAAERQSARLTAKAQPVPASEAVPEAGEADISAELALFNGWGGFSQDGREYRIALRGDKFLTAPWSNVVANEKFGFLVTELGTGYTWWRNSRECKLTPWSNDPVLDPPGEACYIRDDTTGQFRSPTPSPCSADSPCTVAHGRGYTRFRRADRDLRQQVTMYVPKSDSVKIIELKLDNTSDQTKELSVFYVCDWVLGVKRQMTASHIVSEWDDEAGVMLTRNGYQETFRDDRAFLTIHDADGAAGASDAPLRQRVAYTADRLEWLGRSGTTESPEAMNAEWLSNTSGPQHDACGAVQLKLTVEPGASRTVYVLLGAEYSKEAALALARKYSNGQACSAALEEAVKFWEDMTMQTTIQTPNREMDYLINGWLLYQALACRMWARTAFYQAGGAFGYRDQLQDSLAMLHAKPDMTRSQIVLHAAHQYEEGDVQHWWHEETHRGIRTKYSDDLLWLPYATTRYIVQTGDATVLDETAPFLRSEPLTLEEHERYEPTVLSDQTGTIYEHCVRAIERASRFGENGMPLMGIGDWNDGMNSVGDLGQGESVWLGWFLCEVLRKFADVCDLKGDAERA